MQKTHFLMILCSATVSLWAQNQQNVAISHKIAQAKQQYNEALNNVKIDTHRYAACRKDPQCSKKELSELSQTLKTNLGIMDASLTILTLSAPDKEK